MGPFWACLIALGLLFGCTLPWEQPPPPPPIIQNYTPPAQNQTANLTQNVTSNQTAGAENITANQTEPWENYTLENGTVIEGDPFANILPRNSSDRIADGSFRINDQPWLPLNVYVIDDGYADAVLVNKGEFYMLVDAGNFEPVFEFLQEMKIDHISVLVASRDYERATGGIPGVLDSFQVDEFWDNGVPQSDQSASYQAILAKVKEKGITVKHPVAGDKLDVSGLRITALNPQKQRLLSNPDNDAIVLKLSVNDFCALLLNPTVQERENALIGTGESLRCDVVTYFKHGEGRPEASLLVGNYAKPKDAIISVGENSDKLPSSTTLERLAIDKVNVWSSENGTVYLTTEGMGDYSIGYAIYDESTKTFVKDK